MITISYLNINYNLKTSYIKFFFNFNFHVQSISRTFDPDLIDAGVYVDSHGKSTYLRAEYKMNERVTFDCD